MPTTVSRTEILADARLTEAAKLLYESDSHSRFFYYWIPGEKHVHIESTAPEFMDHMTRFSALNQALLVHAIVKHLPEPGDAIILGDGTGSGKARSAFISRLKGRDNEIHLLITR